MFSAYDRDHGVFGPRLVSWIARLVPNQLCYDDNRLYFSAKSVADSRAQVELWTTGGTAETTSRIVTNINLDPGSSTYSSSRVVPAAHLNGNVSCSPQCSTTRRRMIHNKRTYSFQTEQRKARGTSSRTNEINQRRDVWAIGNKLIFALRDPSKQEEFTSKMYAFNTVSSEQILISPLGGKSITLTRIVLLHWMAAFCIILCTLRTTAWRIVIFLFAAVTPFSFWKTARNLDEVLNSLDLCLDFKACRFQP